MHAWEPAVSWILIRFDWAILLYFLIVNGSYAVQLIVATRVLRRHQAKVWQESRWRVLGSEVAPSISILAPAYNEESTISESVSALLTLRYQQLELIVVNDGSRDGTLDVLRKTFDLVPIHPIFEKRIDHRPIRALYRSRSYANLIVADKENGGKADALNAALNLATGALVCAIDADTLIEPDALQRMIRPFLLSDEVLAAGGTIRIANGSTVSAGRVAKAAVPPRPVPGFQIVEYLRAFLFGRLAWNSLGGNLIISGAFGLFRRSAVIAGGGYLHGTVGEDMELVVRLRRQAYETSRTPRVDFIPDPVAWTEAPEQMRVLGRQRDRWHRGLAEVLYKHRRLLFNRRYGAMGLVVFPWFVFAELLAPVVELLGVIGVIAGLALGILDVPFAILFFLVAYGFGAVLSLATVVMEEFAYHRYGAIRDRLFLILWALLENFGYRQYTVFWRIRGLLNFLRGSKEWGSMERKGFSAASSS